MGTREVYEEKLRSGNIYHHDPTMNPGLGSPRCPRCLSLIHSHSKQGEWAITPVLHDATAVVVLKLVDLKEKFLNDYENELLRTHLYDSNVDYRRDYHSCVISLAGCGIGGLLGAIHSFNTGFPYVQKHVKGPMWLPFLIGVPSLLTLSAGSALFGGYALPKFTQLTVTSYYAASSASNYGISLLTRHIEESYTSRSQKQLDDQLQLRKL